MFRAVVGVLVESKRKLAVVLLYKTCLDTTLILILFSFQNKLLLQVNVFFVHFMGACLDLGRSC